MKFTKISPYILFISTTTVFASTLTDPPVKTVTEILTVTYTPSETKPTGTIVTKTVYQPESTLTSHDQANPINLKLQNPVPAQIPSPLPALESTSDVQPNEEDSEIEEWDFDELSKEEGFGYDANYFGSRLGKEDSDYLEKEFYDLNNLNDNDEEDEIEVEDEDDSAVEIKEINREDNENNQNVAQEFDDEETFENLNDAEEDNGNENDDENYEVDDYDKLEAKSPYHLDPLYKGTTHPKEVEKSKPADQTDQINQSDATLDQNLPSKQQQPESEKANETIQIPATTDLSNKKTHSNFSDPKYNEEGHPIPNPIGDEDPEPSNTDEAEDEITKGKQVLDTDDTNKLVSGNKSSNMPKRVDGYFGNSNRFSQDILDEQRQLKSNKTKNEQTSGKRKPFKTSLTRMEDESDGVQNIRFNLNNVLFIVAILSGFIALA